MAAQAVSIASEIAAGLHSYEIERELDKLAERVAEYAKGIAPVFGDRDPRRAEPGDGGDPGDYRDSIEVVPDGPGRRLVGSWDKKALWIEVGTRHMPEYAVFTKTGAHFGDTRGPIIDEGVRIAQGKLRHAIDRLAEIHADASLTGVARDERIARQRKHIEAARQARSSEFRTAKNGRRRARRHGYRPQGGYGR